MEIKHTVLALKKGKTKGFLVMLSHIFSHVLVFYGFIVEGNTIRNCISAIRNYLCMSVPAGAKQICILIQWAVSLIPIAGLIDHVSRKQH